MSLFSWFTRKSAPARPKPQEPSGMFSADATVPLVPGRDGKPQLDMPPVEHAANRKNERMERRELLYAVVRDSMVRAAVLSASYKFKVLSLDQRGRQFLVMMDISREYGGDAARLSEIEALIAQTAKARHDIAINAVYWRLNDHVAVGAPQGAAAMPSRPAPLMPSTAPAASAAAPTAASVRAPLAPAAKTPAPSAPPRPAPAAAARPAGGIFDPIEADEVAAFKQALASAGRSQATTAPGVAVRSGPSRPEPSRLDFEDTEMPETRSQDLSGTQYGDL